METGLRQTAGSSTNCCRKLFNTPMKMGLQLERKSQQPEHTVETQLARQQICRRGAWRARAKHKQCRAVTCKEKIKHPTGMCKRDITHQAGGKPLQRAPHAALSAHAVGEAAGVRAAKGKAARGPENILQGKTEQAGTSQHRQRWLNRETRAVVFRCVQKLHFSTDWSTSQFFRMKWGSFPNCKESERTDHLQGCGVSKSLCGDRKQFCKCLLWFL